ncbi:MAG: FtsX-like permease family protein [Microscillaceae bacterium]|jgi:ABC-type lipoprotein release transport system permease subunit|nr:FtsX-like permease family protein [Microscillaceae bacterium]
MILHTGKNRKKCRNKITNCLNLYLELILAWRNLGRSPRRTLLTMLMIALATGLAVFLRAQQVGTHKQLIINTLGVYTGKAQIRARGDSSFVFDTTTSKKLAKIVFSPRLESSLSLKSAYRLKVAQVIGIIPEREQDFSKLRQKLLKGNYFELDSRQSLILSEQLAQKLKVATGDSLQILVNQSIKHFVVQGIVRLPNPELNQNLAYIALEVLQQLLNKPQQISVIALQSDSYENLNLSPPLEYKTWEAFAPELAQMLQADMLAENLLMSIFYLLMLFGIFSTVMMSSLERRYEWAVLLSLGMKRRQLTWLIGLEISLLALLGIALGLLGLLPCLIYLQNNPIELQGVMANALKKIGLSPKLYYELSFEVLGMPVLLIFLWSWLALLYPVRFIQQIKIASHKIV